MEEQYDNLNEKFFEPTSFYSQSEREENFMRWKILVLLEPIDSSPKLSEALLKVLTTDLF